MKQVPLVTTVEEFRKLYSSRQGQDPDVCRLIFSGKELEDVKLGNGQLCLYFYPPLWPVGGVFERAKTPRVWNSPTKNQSEESESRALTL